MALYHVEESLHRLYGNTNLEDEERYEALQALTEMGNDSVIQLHKLETMLKGQLATAREECQRIQKKAQSYERKVNNIRIDVQKFMMSAETTDSGDSIYGYRLGKPKLKPEAMDVFEVPDEFVVEKTTRSLNRDKILAHIQSGLEQIKGITVLVSQTLTRK